MTVIILTPDQSDAVAKATGEIELHDTNGRILGTLSPTHRWSREEIEEAARRLQSGGPWLTPEEVRERMAALERSFAGQQQ